MPLITALAPAIEIIDLDAAEEDLERILVGNIFHRHVMIGSLSSQELDVPLSALSVSIRLNGLDVQRGLKPGLEARRMSDLLEHVVSTLAGFSEVVEAGSVIISGALSTPIPVGPGDQVEVRVDPVGQLAVKFA